MNAETKLNEDSVAKGLNESPLTSWLWTTVRNLDVKRVEEVLPVEVGIEDLVVVRRDRFIRRRYGYTSVRKIVVRRGAQRLELK